MAIRVEESLFHELDIAGQWLSWGLLSFSMLLPCVSALSLELAESLAASTAGIHYFVMCISQFVSLTTLTTGYFEHKDRRVVAVMITCTCLQAWTVVSDSCCSHAFLRWLHGLSAELRPSDLVSFVSPILVHPALIWAYTLNRRLRLSTASQYRKRRRSA